MGTAGNLLVLSSGKKKSVSKLFFERSWLPAAFSHTDATLGKQGWHPLLLEEAFIYFLKEWSLTCFFSFILRRRRDVHAHI